MASSAKSSKKQQLYLNINNKLPLEVINELHTESFNDSFKLNEEKRKKSQDKLNFLSSENLQIKLLKEKKTLSQNYSYKNDQNFDDDITPEDNKSLGNQKKTSTPKLKKMSDKSKQNLNDAWRSIIISNIIPENKLLSSNNEEILYQGFLDKFHHASRGNNLQTKFCVCLRTEFLCFKSKETFLTMQNPSHKINFTSVVSCKRINLSDKLNKTNKQMFYFFIDFRNSDFSITSFRDNKSISKIENEGSDHENKEKSKITDEEINLQQFLGLNIGENKTVPNLKTKKISLIDSSLSLDKSRKCKYNI